MTAPTGLVVADAGSLQLCLAHLALGGYALAITRLGGRKARVASVLVAAAASVGLATIAPSWPSAVVLLAAGIVAVASVAAGAWTLSALLAREDMTWHAQVDEPASNPTPEPLGGNGAVPL